MPSSYLARVTTGKAVAAWLAMSALCALAGFWLTHDPTPAYRYCLTVEVETPEGLRTGSSVIEVDTYIPSGFFGLLETMQVNARGEAVAVDLPGSRKLFALLRSENDHAWASGVMSGVVSRSTRKVAVSPEARLNNLLLQKGQFVVPRTWPKTNYWPERSAYPMMVTFGNPADPKSVERVNPDNLVASFGEGVKLKRITVEMTDDPVTSTIRSKLPWLETTRGALGHVARSDRPPSGTPLPLFATLTEADFERRL